jgi:hypothetical protein
MPLGLANQLPQQATFALSFVLRLRIVHLGLWLSIRARALLWVSAVLTRLRLTGLTVVVIRSCSTWAV